MSKFSIIYLRESNLPFKGERLKVDRVERLVVCESIKEAIKLAPIRAFKGFYLLGVKQI